MSDSIKVWQPSSSHFGTSKFVVLSEGPMKRQQYEMRLMRRLEALVEKDPQEATELLTDSPEQTSTCTQSEGLQPAGVSVTDPALRPDADVAHSN